MATTIHFYDEKLPFPEFSNFHGQKDRHFTLVIDGQQWPTVEHYYQSQKFTGSDAAVAYGRLVGTASTPNKCFVLARQKKKGGYGAKWVHSKANPALLNDLIEQYKADGVSMRPDFEEKKDAVMIKGVRAKFEQNPHLLELLLSTGESSLHEHTSRDAYWGDGGNGLGQSKLGQILVDVRSRHAKTKLKRKREPE